MADSRSHLDSVVEVSPSSSGCEDCHATAHWKADHDHPVIHSYEPGEDRWWCYADQLLFEMEGASPSPSHP